jgi:Uma2 family endonuclease
MRREASELEGKPMTPAVAEEAAPVRHSRRGEPVWEIANLYPPQGYWTEQEYLALDTNHLIEFDHGFLEFLPMPPLSHQFIVRYLFLELHAFAVANSAGQTLFAPLWVRVEPEHYREPDIVFIRRERFRITKGPAEGADLVMEVVSEGPENRERDLVKKPEIYAAAGIAEYWIVDPEKHEITVLTLDGNAYREHGKFGSGTQAASVLLPGFSLSVDAVFAAGAEAS